MEILPVYLFKDSFGPFLTLLNEHQVRYRMREFRDAGAMASSGVIEIVQAAVGNVALWGALAAVLVAFIKARYGRKVMITTKDNTIVQAEGLSPKELERVLEDAKSLSVIDLNKHQDEESPARSE